MKINASPRLFWFLKKGTQLDLNEPPTLDSYVQQVLTRGSSNDVRELLKTVDPENFRQSFQRIRPFIPREVQAFWEDFFADHHPPSKGRS